MDSENDKGTSRPTSYHYLDGTQWVFSQDLWLNLYVRPERDIRLSNVLWRVERYVQQTTLGITTTETSTKYIELLTYIQSLRDFPDIAIVNDTFTDATNWPDKI